MRQEKVMLFHSPEMRQHCEISVAKSGILFGKQKEMHSCYWDGTLRNAASVGVWQRGLLMCAIIINSCARAT